MNEHFFYQFLGALLLFQAIEDRISTGTLYVTAHHVSSSRKSESMFRECTTFFDKEIVSPSLFDEVPRDPRFYSLETTQKCLAREMSKLERMVATV